MCCGLETGTHTLLVVGDSLAVGDAPHLARELPGWSIETRATDGKETADGVREVASAAPVARLVVSLGTNDDPGKADAFSAAIEDVLSHLEPSGLVVWPDIVSPPVGGTSFDDFNRALADTRSRDGRLAVAGWTALARENPRWLTADGIHPTEEGYAARAAAIAAMLR